MSTCNNTLRSSLRIHRIALLPRQQCRHESTNRRHQKMLHVPEAPSYTPDRSAPALVYNPPSSAPNVYNTPSKFLPRDDSRKKLYEQAIAYSTQAAHRRQTPSTAAPGTPLQTTPFFPPKPSAKLPPAVREPYQKSYHLTQSDIDEIRSLRAQDPQTWTRVKLAEKFQCSQFFVGMVAKNEEKAKQVATEHAAARKRWGQRRRMAREDRGRRKGLWGRDA